MKKRLGGKKLLAVKADVTRMLASGIGVTEIGRQIAETHGVVYHESCIYKIKREMKSGVKVTSKVKELPIPASLRTSNGLAPEVHEAIEHVTAILGKHGFNSIQIDVPTGNVEWVSRGTLKLAR